MSVRKSYTQSKIDGILDKIYLWKEKLTRSEKIYLKQYIQKRRQENKHIVGFKNLTDDILREANDNGIR